MFVGEREGNEFILGTDFAVYLEAKHDGRRNDSRKLLSNFPSERRQMVTRMRISREKKNMSLPIHKLSTNLGFANYSLIQFVLVNEIVVSQVTHSRDLAK